MQFTKTLCLFAMMITATPLHAAAPDPGRALHDRHCLSCHEASVYSRSNRYVKSLKQLKRETKRWSGQSNPRLKNKEIEEIVDYLNRAYYQFQ
jgi:mono/diheme cytochrome c family protein